ncbi:autophagy-related protein 9 [Plakobranchus ocellatus]|uniref:Autophagy-related protein 9 n=1 Tax=Plakobranchus ocellatus TaxID=259542 RepID=A0AAV3XZK6_9GAST|nr:autophagy-related protein 9 [Plakobranchus ocellatus]
MASDSEEIEYMALSTAPFRPTARQKTSDNADEDDESDIFMHEEEGLLVHMSHEDNKSQWNHVDDLDKFFTSVYDYHQRHGFQNMVLAEILQLLQFLFIVLFVTYLSYCVNYPELFDEIPHKNISHKKTLSDITYSAGVCTQRIPFFSWLLLFLCSLFFVGRCIKMAVNFCNYLRTRNFFISALNTETSDLSNMTWHEVQIRLLEVQKEQQICIHKQELTELDIYHRILRFKNYLVAMVNKELLPLKFQIPFIGKHALLTHGMRFNLDILLYWSPWSIFVNSYTMREEYKSHFKRKQLSDQLSTHIALLALLNLVLSPFIFFYQIIYFFFRYAEFVKRSPSFLGSRQWANYGRLYLRHFNELDHELIARLNRAYVPSTMYMRSFTSPFLIIIAKYVAFFAGAPVAILLVLGILDFNDVTKVEHLFTIASVCGMVATVCSGLIPDENEVFCPERLMMSILAQIHYMPGHWKGKAHTSNVRDEFSMLFQYKVVYILEELLSPIFTPFWLLFCLRPKSAQIVDFFRCFTVEVSGVGDVCSFAQMDIKKHGNQEWTPSASANTCESKVPKTHQGENGKIELSLMHFTSTNPEWKPPRESSNFVAGVKQEVQKDLPALTSIIADPISLPSLGYVNPLPSFFPMGTSLHQSFPQSDQLQTPTVPLEGRTSGPSSSHTIVGHASGAGARLKGGLSSLDYPVVNNALQHTSMAGSTGPGCVTTSSLVSNTGSFYSTDFNSLSLVDEGQREMLSGNMSLSVLHLYETQHRRRFQGASGAAATGIAAAGRNTGFGAGSVESYGYNTLPGTIHSASGTSAYASSSSAAARAGYSPHQQTGGVTYAKNKHLTSLASATLTSSPHGHQQASFAEPNLPTTPVEGLGSTNVLSSPHETLGRSFDVGNFESLQQQEEGKYSETSSLALSTAPDHRRLTRLNNAPLHTEDSESLARDFHYGSTLFGSTEPLHPLAQRFRRNEDIQDGTDLGELSRSSQSPSHSIGLPRSPVVPATPTSPSPSAPGSRSHMPQIEEDMTGEQELDTSTFRSGL